MAKPLVGDEWEEVKAYKSFFKINQYPLDNALKEVMPSESSNTSLLILTFLAVVLVYFIYDLITCMKEDREKYQ